MSEWTDAQRAAADALLEFQIAQHEQAQQDKADERAWRADRRYWHYPENGDLPR